MHTSPTVINNSLSNYTVSGKKGPYFACNFDKFRQLSQFLAQIIPTFRGTEKL